MKERPREFLSKLYDLMLEYGVDIDISESCRGYGGFQVDGLEFDIYNPEDGYSESVKLEGRYFNCNDIKELLNEQD